jgi:hypothetical protein
MIATFPSAPIVPPSRWSQPTEGPTAFNPTHHLDRVKCDEPYALTGRPPSALLANGLGGPNPTLTTQALATRTAEKIMGKYFDGEPWVGIETSTSSIDDKVTQAVIDRGL